jgi:hypothetical protein
VSHVVIARWGIFALASGSLSRSTAATSMSDNGSVATIVRFPPAVSEVIASMCASATSRTFTHGSRRSGTIGSEQTGTWYIGGNGEIGGGTGTGEPPGAD